MPISPPTPTALDITAAEVATELLNEFGKDVLFRAPASDVVFLPDSGRMVSFYSSGLTIQSSDNSINWVGMGSWDFMAKGLIVGDWFLLSGNENYNNEGWLQVVAITSHKLTANRNLQNENIPSNTLYFTRYNADYPVKGYVIYEEQFDAFGVSPGGRNNPRRTTTQGDADLSYDAIVLIDLNSPSFVAAGGIVPNPKTWLFFEGNDPTLAKEYKVVSYNPIYSGQLAPLAYVGLRA